MRKGAPASGSAELPGQRGAPRLLGRVRTFPLTGSRFHWGSGGLRVEVRSISELLCG